MRQRIQYSGFRFLSNVFVLGADSLMRLDQEVACHHFTRFIKRRKDFYVGQTIRFVLNWTLTPFQITEVRSDDKDDDVIFSTLKEIYCCTTHTKNN